MKKIYYIVLFYLTSSCSSYKIIDSFLKNESKDDKRSIYIVSEIAPSSINVKGLKGLKSTMNKQMFPGSKLVAEDEKIRLYNLYKNDNEVKFWQKRNFKSNNIQLISGDHKTLERFLSINVNNKSSVLYMFSKPILTSDKRHLFFYYYKKTDNDKEYKNSIVVMRKQNGVWQVVEEYDVTYING